MKEKAFRELHMELCWNIVKGGKKMDYINAFWVGGLICALAQILLDLSLIHIYAKMRSSVKDSKS